MEQGKKMIAEAMDCVASISCKDYCELKDSGETYILLDVREESEWIKKHMEEAIHLPRGLIEVKIEQIVPDKNTLIILVCAKGGRAALAGKTLEEMGYKNIEYLAGGFDGYCEECQV